MAKREEVDALFDEAKRSLGRIDILVNNAGVYGFAPLEEITEEHFRRHFPPRPGAAWTPPAWCRVPQTRPAKRLVMDKLL